LGGTGAEVKVAPGAASGLGLREIRGIGMDMENHITGMVNKYRIRVRGRIVEELGEGLGGGMGGLGGG
jgi:hypothetical protein